jgi:phenylacetic acid degradation operon negative regulatory protein
VSERGVARLDEGDSPTTNRSRTLVVSFLGAVVRRFDDWMPIGGTVDLLGQLGLDPPSVRTAVFRLKRRDWLASESRGGVRGYGLTDGARGVLAAGDQVIWHARQPADLADGWCIVSFSIPESDRTRRHQLRSHLSSLGFGNAGSGLWIAPARMRDAAEAAIAELDLTSRCVVFVGAHAGGQQLVQFLSDSGDLPAIDTRYVSFIHAYGGILESLRSRRRLEPAQACTTYLDVVDHWRRLPLRDPGLPVEVLPHGWSGPAAVALFEELVDRLEKDALSHAATHWPNGFQPRYR